MTRLRWFVAGSLFLLVTAIPVLDSAAQSATKKADTEVKSAKIALDGNCPVCIVEMQKWVTGDEKIQVEFDGQKYLFPGEDQKAMFLTDPVKYAPALGGDCIVCFALGGNRARL